MHLKLNQISAAKALTYDRSKVLPGIVHLGVGAFHRAHMAAYIDEILKFDQSWGIIGASLRQSTVRDALAAQDFLYTHLMKGPDGNKARVIGSLLNVLDASAQRHQLLEALANPQTRIVSLTVTRRLFT